MLKSLEMQSDSCIAFTEFRQFIFLFIVKWNELKTIVKQDLKLLIGYTCHKTKAGNSYQGASHLYNIGLTRNNTD